MTSEHGPTASDDLKAALRRVFDTQIQNYGSYNLVCAAPAADGGRHYVLGYRWNPLELIFAPFDPASLTALEMPMSVGSTNLAHTARIGPGRLEVADITGRVFSFMVEPRARLVGPGGTVSTVEQEDDLGDFNAFLEQFRRIG